MGVGEDGGRHEELLLKGEKGEAAGRATEGVGLRSSKRAVYLTPSTKVTVTQLRLLFLERTINY